MREISSPHSAQTQKVGVLTGEEFNDKEAKYTLKILSENGIVTEIVAESLKAVTEEDGHMLHLDMTFMTAHPAIYDAIYLVGGKSNNQLKLDQFLSDFTRMQYKHLKPIGLSVGNDSYLTQSEESNPVGVVMSAANNPDFAEQFVEAIAKKRFWARV